MAIKLDQKYQMLPNMSDEQFKALKADIAERGVLTPIDVDENGFILDGHHRYRACIELGVTDFPTIIRLDLSEDEKRMFARKSNMLRRHLTREQMQEIIASQLKDTPNWANNRIGQELGVDSKTVAAVRERLEATSEIPKLNRLIGIDGKERPVKQIRKPSIMAANEAEYNEVLDKVSREVSALTGHEFLSVRQAMIVIVTPQYDEYAGLSEDEKKEWDCYCLFLGGQSQYPHIEWLRQHGWQTPTEWLESDEATHYRAIYGMKKPSLKFKNAWDKFWKEKQMLSREDIFAVGQTNDRQPVGITGRHKLSG